MSQQHRHEYAADFPRGLPARLMKTSREVLAAKPRQQDALQPAQIRQVRAGVKVKDVTTPVPHVLLFAIAPQTYAIWQY